MRCLVVSFRFPQEFPTPAKSFLKTGVRFRTHEIGNFYEGTRSTTIRKWFPRWKLCGQKVSSCFLQVSCKVSSRRFSMLPQCPTCQAMTNPTWQTCPVCQQPLNGVRETAARPSVDTSRTPPDATVIFTHPQGHKVIVSLYRCPQCSGTNWGPKLDDPEEWWCLDCHEPEAGSAETCETRIGARLCPTRTPPGNGNILSSGVLPTGSDG